MTIEQALNSMERQSEIIAALRNEVSTWKNGFNAANEALQYSAKRIAELEAQVKALADANQAGAYRDKDVALYVAQLEAQLAAVLATVDAATAPDGRTYAEGCKP